MRRLRPGMAQINTTVGDFKGNTKKILAAIDEGKARGVDIITFPELASVAIRFWPYPLLAYT
jgi:NAD+ synthase (glutamine-hydrolysing)